MRSLLSPSEGEYRGPIGRGNPETALIGLGANLPLADQKPIDTLRRAAAALGRLGVVRAVSGVWTSPAWPDPADPPYVNAVALMGVDTLAEDTLRGLLALEAEFGREREAPNAPRTLDLDLIDQAGAVVSGDSEAALTLPHPRAHERAFVLLPLREVAPRWRHPQLGLSVESLIADLPAAARSVVRRHSG